MTVFHMFKKLGKNKKSGKQNQIELVIKTKMCEMGNIVSGISRLDIAEEKISELKAQQQRTQNET